MILGFRHVGIVVANLERMLGFYEGLLGLYELTRAEEEGDHLDKMLGLKGVKLTTVKLQIPTNGILELLCYRSPHSRLRFRHHLDLADIFISHIAMTVDDVEAEYQRLSAARIKFNSAPQVSGKAKVAFARDPEGNFLELVEVLA